jgi:phosphatidylglycerophosphatase A
MKRLAFHIATVFGLGDRLPAPGTTAGSLPAVVGWWLAMVALPDVPARCVATAVGTVLVAVIGVWASQVEARRRGGEDPGAVVIDEVAGQWLTLLPVLLLLARQTRLTLAVAAAVGFLLFRLFDIVKPWPVRSFERLPGGFGIMADDLVAALFAGALSALVLALVGV